MRWIGIEENRKRLTELCNNAPVEYVGPRGGKNARTIKDENDDHIWAAPFAHWCRALNARGIKCPSHTWYNVGAWGKSVLVAIPRPVAEYIVENAPDYLL